MLPERSLATTALSPLRSILLKTKVHVVKDGRTPPPPRITVTLPWGIGAAGERMEP